MVFSFVTGVIFSDEHGENAGDDADPSASGKSKNLSLIRSEKDPADDVETCSGDDLCGKESNLNQTVSQVLENSAQSCKSTCGGIDGVEF